MSDALPLDISQGATLRGSEYGWTLASFPDAIARASASNYACLGGQFQFRLDEGAICEMYWLKADSNARTAGETWADYSRRSCSEVLSKFRHFVSTSDFVKEASNWPTLEFDPVKTVVFVAYFVTEADLADPAQ